MPRKSESVTRVISSQPRMSTRSRAATALARARADPASLIEAFELLDARNRERQHRTSSLAPPQVPVVVVHVGTNTEQTVARTARVSTPSSSRTDVPFEIRPDTPSPVQEDSRARSVITPRHIARPRSPRTPSRGETAVAGPSNTSSRNVEYDSVRTPKRQMPQSEESLRKRVALGELEPMELLTHRLAPARENDDDREGGRENRKNQVPVQENQNRRRYEALVTVQGDGIGDEEALVVALALSEEERRRA